MADSYDYYKLDGFSYAAVVNIYTLTKHSDKIILDNFDATNPDHLGLLVCGSYAANIFGKKLYVHGNPIKFWHARYTKHAPKIASHKFFISKKTPKIDTIKFIDDLTKARNYKTGFSDFLEVYMNK